MAPILNTFTERPIQGFRDALSNGLWAIGIGLGILIAAAPSSVLPYTAIACLGRRDWYRGGHHCSGYGYHAPPVVALAGPAIGAGIVAIASGIAAAAIAAAAQHPGSADRRLNAVKNSAPALGEALKHCEGIRSGGERELIILAGHAIRDTVIYQTLKQKMPELVQIWTMVITGALQTIRTFRPDVLATIIDLLWQLHSVIVQNA